MSAARIILYDANNWLRRRFEGGAGVRVVFMELAVNPGLVVFDGPHSLKRRREIFAGYKVRDKEIPTEVFEQMQLVQALCEFLPVTCIRVPGWEADDVIATLIHHAGCPARIHTTDADFLQIKDVEIDQTKGLPCTYDMVRTYKACVGDPSDKIPGIKGFGKGKWGSLNRWQQQRLQDYITGKSNKKIDFLGTACDNWLLENKKLVKDFYALTTFYDVPLDEIEANMVVGSYNLPAAEIIFGEYML